MTKANDYQIDGNHYCNGENETQHWDWAKDLPYLEGCATKYIARHQRKRGLRDLEKAMHFLAKIIEERYPEHSLYWKVEPVARAEEALIPLPAHLRVRERAAAEALIRDGLAYKTQGGERAAEDLARVREREAEEALIREQAAEDEARIRGREAEEEYLRRAEEPTIPREYVNPD